MFEKIDTNNNGYIELEEMQDFSSGIFENQFESAFGRSANWRELFSIMDHNNDGQVSYQEFLTGACNKAELMNEETLREAFNILDRNEDGFLDLEEFKWRFSYVNMEGLTSEL